MEEKIIKIGNRVLKDKLENQGMRNKLIKEIKNFIFNILTLVENE